MKGKKSVNLESVSAKISSKYKLHFIQTISERIHSQEICTMTASSDHYLAQNSRIPSTDLLKSIPV